MKNDLGSSCDSLATFVLHNGESTSSVRFPPVLVIIVGFSYNSDSLSDQVSRVEPYSELTNHRNICSSRNGFHESFGSRLGNCSQIVDKFGLAHTYSCVLYSESIVALIGDDFDSHVGLSL